MSQFIGPLPINSIVTDSFVRAFLWASAPTFIGQSLEMDLLVRGISILNVNRRCQIVVQMGCETPVVSSGVHMDPPPQVPISSRRSHSFPCLPT